jgi:hypothetical protein
VITLFVSLALLGLAAIDPIGIAAMPVLLVQQRPYARSFAFLSGSFVSLMVMGLLCARGFGQRVLHFQNVHPWFVPGVELLAGLILLIIAGVVFWQLRRDRLPTGPSDKLQKQLRLSSWHVCLLGAALVAVQSILDVVFVIAMIRIGQLQLSSITLWLAVTTYAVAALVLQIAIVAAYSLTGRQRRRQLLAQVQTLLVCYANQAVIAVSLILGCGLLVDAMLTLR